MMTNHLEIKNEVSRKVGNFLEFSFSLNIFYFRKIIVQLYIICKYKV